MLWSGAFSFASGSIRAAKYGYAYATKNTEMMAKFFTHNPNAAAAMLGHYDKGAATGYVAQAKAGGHTYFSMSNRQWTRLVARFSKEGMWDINQAFLSQQISLGKVFLFSHQEAVWGSYYHRELIYLTFYGIF